MRIIKRLMGCILLIIILIQCERHEPGVNITDDNFLKALIESGVDKDGNGIISSAEAAAVTSLNLSSRDISEMNGIEAFINLDTLICFGNAVTDLDISNCPGLRWLDCYDNKLTSLDVSHNDLLEDLSCSANQLTSLDVSNLTALQNLDCNSNQLGTLDISNNPALKVVWCILNQLTSLDLSNNHVLKELYVYNNLLTSLDLSDNTALEWLACSENQLTSLDVSNLLDLRYLGCGGNQITSLDISNNTSLGLALGNYYIYCYLGINNMPSLEKVCVWRLPFPPRNFSLCTEGSPNVYFTTDCSK